MIQVLLLLDLLAIVGIVSFGLARNSIQRPGEPTVCTSAHPVKGRAPGLSEHASPFGQTEARAERTLERPPP
jgi:hypothetical protein